MTPDNDLPQDLIDAVHSARLRVDANIWFEPDSEGYDDDTVQARHMASLFDSVHSTLNDLDPADIESIIVLGSLRNSDDVFCLMGGDVARLPQLFGEAMLQLVVARTEPQIVPEDLQP